MVIVIELLYNHLSVLPLDALGFFFSIIPPFFVYFPCGGICVIMVISTWCGYYHNERLYGGTIKLASFRATQNRLVKLDLIGYFLLSL